MKFVASQMSLTQWHSPLGVIYLACSPKGLTGLWFEDSAHRPDMQAWSKHTTPLHAQAIGQLSAYFSAELTTFSLPLDLDSGTNFQRAVWRALLELPYGTTASYGALSARIDRPRAVRAVSSAIGRNPLSIIVPCHRVVGADGSLTGYAGGLSRKTALLRLEGALAGGQD